ncbi:MAG: beta strand repeat-containing protein [Candidatus Neomarinimicrobiota bacterium]
MKNLFTYLALLFSLTTLGADTIVTTITGGTVNANYFNSGNGVQLVVTFQGDNADGGSSDDTEKWVEVYIGWSTTASVGTPDVNMNSSNGNVSVQKASSSGGASDIIFNISNAQIQASHSDPNGKYFKMGIKVDGESIAAATSNADGGSSHKADFSSPYLTSLTYPGTDNRGFNIQKMVYSLNEAVIAGSQIIFQGTGSGDTGDHVFNLTGGNAGTGTKTVNTITFDSGGDLVANATYDVDAYLIDAAGNIRSRYRVRTNNTYDATRPRIASAATSAADGTYKIGDTVPVTLTFSESIFTDGTMRVTFETGDDDKHQDVGNFASYGSRVSTKAFNWVVSEGAVTNDLTIKTIAMSSGSIIDLGYNAANNFTLTGDNIAANHAIVIDGVKPTITKIESDKANGTYGIGEQISVTVTFSEAVTLSGGNLVITMETGANDTQVPAITSLSNSATVTGVYTVVADDVSSDLTVKSVGTTGAVKDQAGNEITSWDIGTNLAAQTGKTIVIETTRPTITNITSTTNNGTYGAGDDLNVRITFSEAVTLSGGGAKISVPLETGDNDATVEINSVTNSATADGIYSVVEGHTTNGNDLAAKSKPTLVGTLKDQAGNEIVDAGLDIPGGQNLSDTKNIKIDAVHPIITNATSTTGDGTYKITDDINLQLDFSENVTLANANLDLTLNTGNGNKGSITTFSDKNTRSVDYTVVEGDVAARLDINTIALAAGATLLDGGGNAPQSWTPNTTFTANKNIVIDGTRPVITKIFSSKTADYYGVGEQIDIQIHFSEAVSTTAANILKATLETGSTNADEELTYGAIDNATVATVTYTVGEDDYNAALTMKSPVVVSGGQKVNDQAGTLGTANEMTTKTIPTGKNLADEVVDIFVDGEYPVDDGTAITVTPKGGNVVSGKFNTTNTSADFGVKLSGAKLGTGTAQSDITLSWRHGSNACKN